MLTLPRAPISAAWTTNEFANVPTTGTLEEDALLVAQRCESDAWCQRVDDLLSIRGLADDWDGQGAKAPPSDLVDSALILAQLLRQRRESPPDRIVPGVNGTVILEWQSGDEYFEIEVTRAFRAEATLMAPGRPPQHWLLNWLLSGA